MEAVRKRRHPIVETAMAMFSLPTTFPDTSAYWTKLDSLIQQGRAFFFSSPPNLDFRQGTDEDAPKAMEEGTGEKVKEAVVKSVDKSKATIEDSAKSAAKVAGETNAAALSDLLLYNLLHAHLKAHSKHSFCNRIHHLNQSTAGGPRILCGSVAGDERTSELDSPVPAAATT
nr:uncharacterized protein LOC109227352 [Ipomoea batatas]